MMRLLIEERVEMRFNMLAIGAALLVALADYLLLPSVLTGLRSNPQIQSYRADPDLTFQVVSQCKQSVINADACYQAYSAAVQLSNLKSCSSEAIAMKRRFKLLVERNTLEAIESGLIKECAPTEN
ncbi:hypothetical protein EXW72_03565 [Pseudomonas sp. BCA14]|uniref:hypothetical protein n=1 Tax=unclassified Pseudomonas TaxID=196821 RepID=UPI00106E6D7E|nr:MULTISPECIES: hypothetical protein [unclassified Pseudomonas]TFF14602.1 hypothetical protein EXW70_08920 [Pseudomonas sp. JMN1]TFF14714.1 hypothetical protein EXW71_00120 [Pseudomonas sp. BCA17]TFF21497.1 hypothetical protein EXW73_21360 [Pseudomonas sp. BCA13]TFF31120.1 hypothetical protein EXW72_03565 [Pseudomonas sp. BCA14]